jgi:hypothetical protein
MGVWGREEENGSRVGLTSCFSTCRLGTERAYIYIWKERCQLVVTTGMVRHDSLISSASCSVRSTQIKWYLGLWVSCGLGKRVRSCTHHTLHSAHLIMGEPSSPFVHVQYADLAGLDFCLLTVGALKDVVVVLMFSLSDGSAT